MFFSGAAKRTDLKISKVTDLKMKVFKITKLHGQILDYAEKYNTVLQVFFNDIDKFQSLNYYNISLDGIAALNINLAANNNLLITISISNSKDMPDFQYLFSNDKLVQLLTDSIEKVERFSIKSSIPDDILEAAISTARSIGVFLQDLSLQQQSDEITENFIGQIARAFNSLAEIEQAYLEHTQIRQTSAPK